ncbi:MAG: hypothetical protein H7839_24075 [Magnetococcus sp. YQC-5]
MKNTAKKFLVRLCVSATVFPWAVASLHADANSPTSPEAVLYGTNNTKLYQSIAYKMQQEAVANQAPSVVPTSPVKTSGEHAYGATGYTFVPGGGVPSAFNNSNIDSVGY